MTLALYAHPFASYCWKVLIALRETGTRFDYRSLADAAIAAEWQRLSPFAKMPVLVDGATTVIETSIIVEWLQVHHARGAALIPGDPVAALEVRLLDRMADLYLADQVNRIVFDAMRPADARDPTGVAAARGALDTAYAWWDERLAGRRWAAGDAFTLADCAAAPALFYADWVQPIPAVHATLRAYRARLLARPSVARTVDEARPYRALFPLGAPDRD